MTEEVYNSLLHGIMTKKEVNQILVAIGYEWDDFLDFVKGQTFTEQDGEPYFFAQDVNRFINAKYPKREITLSEATQAVRMSDKLDEYNKILSILTNCAYPNLCFMKAIDQIDSMSVKDEVIDHLRVVLRRFVVTRIEGMKADIKNLGVNYDE